MADFKTHWRVGLVTSTATAMSLSSLKMCDTRLLPLLVIIGWVGSIIPDIDSDTSRPRRLIFDGLCFLLPPAMIYRIPILHLSPVYAVVFWALTTWVILKPIKWFFKKFTKHRGVYHSIPAAFIFACLCALLAFHESAPKHMQLSVALVALVGFLTHLTLDELWAVDFNGKLPSRKRSFGTALCLGSRNYRDNVLLYVTLLVCIRSYWALWHEIHFLPEIMRVILSGWTGAFLKIISGEGV